jgi:signal transduction histidine kinase
LSHRLHSSTLDNLGLAHALGSLCAEFSDYHSIQVNFSEENTPRSVPREIALCLFRITQEALQNVKKHSGADSVDVRLEGTDQEIHLSVSDNGSGFDPESASTQGGIGIRSMEERVRLVGGQFAIHARPMEGTRIDASVPLQQVIPSPDLAMEGRVS